MEITIHVGARYPDLTGSNGDGLAKEILQYKKEKCRRVILDFNGVENIGSMAVAVLSYLHSGFLAERKELMIRNASERVARSFRIHKKEVMLEPVGAVS